MDIFGVLQMIGGLCLFLFGMETMGDGLTRTSGSKLEGILGNLTSSVPRGVVLGCVVTAVIQSSSATTVMLVGFVNSGIMQLSQAIPVIMGANIGTTATAWLLSLTALDGDSVFMQLLKPMSFSPILAAIAIVFMMFMKSEKKYNIGMILIGFAVLMYGYYELGSRAAEGCAGICKHSDHVLKSGTGSGCRNRIYGGNPEFICFSRYSAGAVPYGVCYIRHSHSYHHGTEYRNLRDGNPFIYRC